MSEPIRPPQTAALDDPVDAIGVIAGDHRVERAIAARTLRAVAGWLRQRANVITQGQWSI
ncbi:hypothetical protein CDG81_22520 [Actinopolyspora erythraea]|uniref:Uncharacterized protein n=1 Tax=Actinopolyspora erythraea TaxID=414996 RepID=A0A099D9I1_9ACTN|nr:hypothetical protein [Actinopolyspora erythraea]ASU80584.1 hypothetical protein CDG81_22520 [Actinopolyspora erythraea]KGI82739.1 hypothetical protein IL38_02320 [Actinopolyspora erythraea]